MRRFLLYFVVIVAVIAAALFALDRTSILVPVSAGGAASMAPAIPACNGRVLAEGVTYHFHSPRRGDIVAIHAAGKQGGKVVPDASSRDLALALRVVGVPGDTVVGRKGAVYVNGLKVDDIETPGFPSVSLGGSEYFLLGDNRTASDDSRTFGPVPRNAIFGRVFFVVWPVRDVGTPGGRKAGTPMGLVC
jgi:signal peptidase I